MKQFIVNNINYYLGENDKENHLLIDMMKEKNTKYWWFHLASFPSGHCIVESEDLDKNMIKNASIFVKINSKHYGYKNIKVNYIQLYNIKKTDKPGEVILLKKPNNIKI